MLEDLGNYSTKRKISIIKRRCSDHVLEDNQYLPIDPAKYNSTNLYLMGYLINLSLTGANCMLKYVMEDSNL